MHLSLRKAKNKLINEKSSVSDGVFYITGILDFLSISTKFKPNTKNLIMQTKTIKISTALLSVLNKDGIVPLAHALVQHDIEIISTGGTGRKIKEEGIKVTDIEDVTGNPECFDDRMKTISFSVEGGILFDREKHAEEAASLGVKSIELVVCNFYELEKAAAQDGSLQNLIKNTDIGGPLMISAAAKNLGGAIPLCDPADYPLIMSDLERYQGGISLEIARYLMKKAWNYLANYRSAAAVAYNNALGELSMRPHFFNGQSLKYGENARDTANMYNTQLDHPFSFEKFTPVFEERAMSSTGVCDVDRATRTLLQAEEAFKKNDLKRPLIAVAVKHGNPCGVGVDSDPIVAIQKMIDGDKESIFGGTVVMNFELDKDLLFQLKTYGQDQGQRFLATVVVKGVSEDLGIKSTKTYYLKNPNLGLEYAPNAEQIIRSVMGGVIVQNVPRYVPDLSGSDSTFYAADTQKIEDRAADILLAWAIGSTSNSNTITIVKDGMLLGNGVSGKSRVEGANSAVAKAKKTDVSLHDSVAYSDSFFPFPDGPDVLIQNGIRTIFSTSGSQRDQDTIELCNKYNVTLLMIPDKIARGFYGHC